MYDFLVKNVLILQNVLTLPNLILLIGVTYRCYEWFYWI